MPDGRCPFTYFVREIYKAVLISTYGTVRMLVYITQAHTRKR